VPARLRTSVVLAVVAAVLLGYILIVERGSLSSSELEQRKGSALPEFVRAHLSKLEIQRKGQTVVLERNPDDTDEGGLWRVTAPYRAMADRDTVESLVGELEFLDARRKLEHVSAEDQKRFGFDAPRYRVWFTVGKLRAAVLVGNESPRGDGVYLRGTDPNTAFVVGKDLVETLDHDARDYHTTELHEGVLVSTAQSLSLHDAQGDRSVRKRADGSWTFEPPLAGLASTPAISETIEAVDHLRAKHFIAQEAKDLAQYGLAEPQFELRLHNKRLLDLGKDKETDKSAAKTEPKHEEIELRLRAGKACAEHSGETYLTVGDSKSVSCVADADVDKLRRSIVDLREGRLLPFDDDAIASLRIEHAGRRLTLTKTDAGFSYEATRPGAAAIKGDARTEAVNDWFAALRGTKADRFEPESARGGAADVKLHVERTENKPAYDLQVDSSPVSGPIAWREAEPVTLVFAPGAAALLDTSAARVRKLAVVQVPEADLRALSIKRASGIEHLSRKAGDSAFNIDAPLHAPADSLVVSELTRLLASLEAVRFVADAPEPAHGLATPFIEIGIEHTSKDAAAKPAHIDIAIGEETEGGRFAQRRDQPGVFVIASRVVQLLSEPLVSRTWLSTPLEQITAIDLEQAGKRVHIERSGEQFAAPGTKLDDAGARSVAEALATLRASRVTAYGPPAADQGLQKPFARVSVSARDAGGVEQHYTIAFGAAAQDGRYARRDDRAVGFVVPKDSADGLLAPLAGP
jgi:uncharacterized protein DUF4340